MSIVAGLAGFLVVAAVAASIPTDAGARAAPIADVASPLPAAGTGPSRPATMHDTQEPSAVPEARGAPLAASVAGSCSRAPDAASASRARPAASGDTRNRGTRVSTRLVLPVGSPGHAVRVAFLGDSYTTGWNGGGYGRAGWPAIVSRALGWRPRNLAVAGTGYVNPGWTGQPIGTRVAAVVAARPRVVVLAAGHNDARFGTKASAAAADAVIDRLRRALPNAYLIVVAPIWANGSPPDGILGLRDRLRRKAASVHALFIDPLRGRWFTGATHRYIGPDGIHPIDAGHRYIARMVLASLRGATTRLAAAAPAPRASRAPAVSSRAGPGSTASTAALRREAACQGG